MAISKTHLIKKKDGTSMRAVAKMFAVFIRIVS